MLRSLDSLPGVMKENTGVVGTMEDINQIARFKGHFRWFMENRLGRQKDTETSQEAVAVAQVGEHVAWSEWEQYSGKAKMRLELGFICGVELTCPDLGNEKKKGIKYNSEIFGLRNCMNGD